MSLRSRSGNRNDSQRMELAEAHRMAQDSALAEKNAGQKGGQTTQRIHDDGMVPSLHFSAPSFFCQKRQGRAPGGGVPAARRGGCCRMGHQEVELMNVNPRVFLSQRAKAPLRAAVGGEQGPPDRHGDRQPGCRIQRSPAGAADVSLQREGDSVCACRLR